MVEIGAGDILPTLTAVDAGRAAGGKSATKALWRHGANRVLVDEELVTLGHQLTLCG